MQIEPNGSLTNKERRNMRIAVICAIVFGVIMLVLTATNPIMRSAGFIIVYAVLIVLCIVLLATVLRDDGTGKSAAPGVRSEDQVISDAVMALKAKQQDAASSVKNGDSAQDAATDAANQDAAAAFTK